MKFKKHIAFLLSLVFMAYLGHSLVPHHHHEGVLQHTEESNCTHAHDHDGEAHHDHDSDVPVHCHAFNDLSFQKHKGPSPQKPELPLLSILLPEIFSLTQAGTQTFTESFQALPPEPLLRGSLSLRGPPMRA